MKPTTAAEIEDRASNKGAKRMRIIFEGPKDTDRGYTIRASETEPVSQDYLVEIMKEREIVRSFLFPAYKVYNLLAHFSDIVDSEIEKNSHGYNLAASNGFGGMFLLAKEQEPE